MKGQPRQPSLDFSVQSSEDGRPVFRRDLDSMSQDSKNGDIFSFVQGPAATAAIHKGAMSEPLRRPHRVKIHEPPKPRRGILTRMASIESPPMTPVLFVLPDSFDCPESTAPENQVQVELESKALPDCVEEKEVQTCELELPGPSEEIPKEQEAENAQETQLQSQIDLVAEPVSQPLFRPKSRPLIPPPSPPRVRRTLEAPATSRPPTPMRTKHRSHSCPRKQIATSSQTPMVNRKATFQWQRHQEQIYDRNQVAPIPNGVCLSESSSISSDSSTDSREFVASCIPAGAEQQDGTLQREMKTLFNQKMREIRCKSPLFFDESE